jgi:hypothetical protein
MNKWCLFGVVFLCVFFWTAEAVPFDNSDNWDSLFNNTVVSEGPPHWVDECPTRRDSATPQRPTSFDFIFELGGWPGPHIANPFTAYLYTQNIFYAFLISGSFEIFERMSLIILGNYVIFIGDQSDNETFDASLIGDWMLQGGIGVILGWFFCRVMRCSRPFTPPLFQYPFQFFVFLVQYGMYNLPIILYGLYMDEPCLGLPVGPYVSIILHPLLISWFYVWNYNPCVWKATWGKLNDWNCPPRTFDDYRNTYIGWLIVNQTLLMFTAIRFTVYSTSMYYQSWLAVFIIVWFLVLFAVAKGRVYEVFGSFRFYRKKRIARFTKREMETTKFVPTCPF